MNVDDGKTDSRLIGRSRRNNPAATSTLPPVINTSEACHYLRISRPTFLKLIASGKIRALKLGKGWKVLDSELERFLLAGETSQQ